MLETDELKQLLQKNGEIDSGTEMLSEDDKEAIVALFKNPFDEAFKTLEKVIGKTCAISEVSADVAKPSLLNETLGDDYYITDTAYKGENVFTSFAFDNSLVKKIAALLLEVTYEEGELSETDINGFHEVFSQMVDSVGKTLTKQLGNDIEFESSKDTSKLKEMTENVVQFTIGFTVGDDINTTFYYFAPFGFINGLIKMVEGEKKEEEEKEPIQNNEEEKKTEEEPIEESTATVQPIRFEELTEELVADEKENMNLLMDLQLQVSVELGKVKKPIKDILQFTQGTIVELDRLAGDNVDVLVSGKIIAKGEVVVVDQNFGVRITKIVIPEKRV